METCHVFMKGRSGGGLFYQLEDSVVFFTLFSALVREMHIKVLAFSMMFNHTHALFAGVTRERVSEFQRRLTILFVRRYNQAHQRTGPLFQHSFGISFK